MPHSNDLTAPASVPLMTALALPDPTSGHTGQTAIVPAPTAPCKESASDSDDESDAEFEDVLRAYSDEKPSEEEPSDEEVIHLLGLEDDFFGMDSDDAPNHHGVSQNVSESEVQDQPSPGEFFEEEFNEHKSPELTELIIEGVKPLHHTHSPSGMISESSSRTSFSFRMPRPPIPLSRAFLDVTSAPVSHTPLADIRRKILTPKHRMNDLATGCDYLDRRWEMIYGKAKRESDDGEKPSMSIFYEDDSDEDAPGVTKVSLSIEDCSVTAQQRTNIKVQLSWGSRAFDWAPELPIGLPTWPGKQ